MKHKHIWIPIIGIFTAMLFGPKIAPFNSGWIMLFWFIYQFILFPIIINKLFL